MAAVIGSAQLTCPSCRTIVTIQILGSAPEVSKSSSIANIKISIDADPAIEHIRNCPGPDSEPHPAHHPPPPRHHPYSHWPHSA